MKVFKIFYHIAIIFNYSYLVQLIALTTFCLLIFN